MQYENDKNVMTLPYLCEQICEFREMFGDKRFWSGPQEIRDLAIKALSFIYINLGTEDGKALSPENNNKAIHIFDQTMIEYSRRERMLLFSGFPIGGYSENAETAIAIPT